MKHRTLISICLLTLLAVASCTQKSNPLFEKEIDGKKTGLYLLTGTNQFTVSVTNYGARIVGIELPAKDGKLTNVVLGFNSLDDYLNSPDGYFGPCVGRVGNRIAKGKFTLDGAEYSLAINNGVNHLHGGLKGLHKVVWDVVSYNSQKLVLKYHSPDMEEGYPGNLDIQLTYSIENGNTLTMAYQATTDKATPVNLTNHAYYNLNGKSNESINNHVLTIFADNYTPVDSTLIPLGTIDPVAGTPFDFTKPKAIGTDVDSANIQLKYGGGYDHNWVLNPNADANGFRPAATVYSPLTGIQMEILTQEPGIQFYGGNFFNGTIITRDGNAVGYRCGLALEPQHYPDAVNQPNFPTTILKPGETYATESKYVFSVMK